LHYFARSSSEECILIVTISFLFLSKENMCGVIGYIGKGITPDALLKGLKRLEYRGYDSAGIAMLSRDEIHIEKAEGKLAELEKCLSKLPEVSTLGIGHTRWATHGKPCELNAHPHKSGPIVLLHNGIIENHAQLRKSLIESGYNFSSETDTEVAAHFLHKEVNSLDRKLDAMTRMKIALTHLTDAIKGSYAFAIMFSEVKDALFVVKQGSPLILGKGSDSNFVASGVAALVEHTRDVAFLEDGDIAVLKANSIEVFDTRFNPVEREFISVDWSPQMLEKDGHDHYMMKEINEHPMAARTILQDAIDMDTLRLRIPYFAVPYTTLREVDRIDFLACGTAYYAAEVAKFFIQEYTGLPVNCELASEYRYRRPTASSKTLVVAVSQSGETIDTLFALKEVKKVCNTPTLAIVNTPGSSIGMAADAEMYLNMGPEIAVASTKAITGQVTSMILLGLAIAQTQKSVFASEQESLIASLVELPQILEACLQLNLPCKNASEVLTSSKSVLFIGRGPSWPVAMEGALKFKELTYKFSEGFAAGELKHGPIALIDPEVTVVCIAPSNQFFEKTISNMQEIKARGGKLIAITDEAGSSHLDFADHILKIPTCSSMVQPLASLVLCHLLSYWSSVALGNDVDQPRNLAKSVTVE
jgi:glutamine---fructose-6-phosphate transaminase (isomerizing)